MSANGSKELVKRFYECLFQELKAVLPLVAKDHVDHNNEQAGLGSEVLGAHVVELLTIFPDFRMTMPMTISLC